LTEKPKNSQKTSSSTTLSTTNNTWNDPDPNPGFRGEIPVTNDLSHGTALAHLTSGNIISVTVSQKFYDSSYFKTVFGIVLSLRYMPT
jgi:hypothetical protein